MLRPPVSIKGSEEIDLALQELEALVQRQAAVEFPSNTTGAELDPTSLGRETVAASNPLRAGLLAQNPNHPFSSFSTLSASLSDVTAVNQSVSTSAARDSCPSFLFASWQRVETDSSDSSSVMLRFTDSSYERLEHTATADGLTRILSQRVVGALQVKCEWSAGATGPSSIPSAATVRLPTCASANVTIIIDGAASSNQAQSLHFIYMPMQLSASGSMQAVMVEQDAGTDGRRRAYLRL